MPSAAAPPTPPPGADPPDLSDAPFLLHPPQVGWEHERNVRQRPARTARADRRGPDGLVAASRWRGCWRC
ncbi:hypothetical protein ACU686_23670 [Yinghuangia aomiensis]